MERKVWVLGSSNIDTTYRVDSIPSKGYTIQAESCTTATGGKGANQAVAAAHWGAKVGFIGAVGEDANGGVLLQVLKSHNIQDEYVAAVGKVVSGNAIILVDKQGCNCITVFPGANQCVPLIPTIPFRGNDILVAQLEVNMDAVEFYFELAKKAGVYTILNPSPSKPISQKLMNNTDMVVANESEACEICRIEVCDADSAKACGGKILEMGPRAAIITLGGMGAVVVTKEKSMHICGIHIEVIDTQGAGDAFLGTLAAKMALGSDIETAAIFANKIASLTVGKKGSTQASLPSAKELKV